jgi:DNA-binding CsgD family transcriptional regulator
LRRYSRLAYDETPRKENFGFGPNEGFLSIGAATCAAPCSGQMPKTTPTMPDVLTPLEREIVSMIGQGFRDCDIDETFWMTRLTLSAHLRSIFAKLGVSDQAELAQLAAHLAPDSRR